MSGPILIIEDDPDIVDILRYTLQSKEYPTRVALNGKEGLIASMDQAEPPSLILLDLLLPEMNGLEICRRLRREKSTRGIPIIMVTAKAGDVVTRSCGQCRGWNLVYQALNLQRSRCGTRRAYPG